MKFFRALFFVLGVVVCGIILLSPLALGPVPGSREIWLFQAIRDMHAGLHLVPTLNGLPLTGQNPIAVLLFSLVPFSDIVSLRLASILLGCAVAAGTGIYALLLWDMKSAAISALLTLTSLGFILTFGTLNVAVIPASMCILSFLLFSLIYIKNYNSWWYIPAYVLVCLSTITGGWPMLAFFAFGILLLILFDLSPGRLLEIRAPWGILLAIGVLGAAYLTYRIAAGSAFVTAVFSQGESAGLFSRLKAFTLYTLPWLPLVLPAWIHTEVDEARDAWRSLLPVKTAFAVGLAIILFAPRYSPGLAVVCVPFGAMLAGYWVAHGFGSPLKVEFIRGICLALTGAVIIAPALVMLSLDPISSLSLDMGSAAGLGFFLVAALVFFWLVKRRSYSAMIALCVAAVSVLTWSVALLQLPAKASAPISSIEEMSTYSPLIVYRDDLVMRGYIEYAGVQPIVVNREIVPIGESVYLAASTDDLDDLIEGLNSRMYTSLISSFEDHETYALIRLSPLELTQ